MDTNTGSSMFQAGSVNIDPAAQNLEEEEDLEDQKRRQEELQSLLTKAMDEFNYDDQSTINSSVNESLHEYAQQYKEAGLENQLEVMYNIRVKEVNSLQDKLQAKEQQLADTKAQMLQKLMLTEAENDKLRTSLKNSQELLVGKCDEIQQFNEQNNRILNDNESLKQILNKLEVEKAATDFNNQELREQVAIFEKGRGTNPLSDVMMQENHLMEVSKLQNGLEMAFGKNQRLEKENETLTEKLNHIIAEKEDLAANKTEVINKLMQNIDQAQEHNRELLNNVTRLTADNERFKSQIQELESSVQMMKGFTDKTEIIKILQKELDKSKHLNTKQTVEFEKLHNQFAELIKECKTKNKQVQMLEEHIACLERKPSMDSHAMQTSRLMESFSVSDQLRDELETYKQHLVQKQTETHKLQEKIHFLEEDIINLHKKLELSAKRDSLTAALQEKATRLEEFILNNKNPETQTKSTNTDSIYIPKTSKQTPTELPTDIQEIIAANQTKFEIELINKEVELRKQLQEEFEQTYESLKNKFASCDKCTKLSQNLEEKQKQIAELQQDINIQQTETKVQDCEMCKEMSIKLIKNVEIIEHQEKQREQYRLNQENDKKIILQLLEEWKLRFEEVEMENSGLKERLEGLMKSFTASQTELAIVKKSEEDLVRIVHSKAKEAVAAWSRDTVQLVQSRNHKIRDFKERIDQISMKADQKVIEIERKYNTVRQFKKP